MCRSHGKGVAYFDPIDGTTKRAKSGTHFHADTLDSMQKASGIRVRAQRSAYVPPQPAGKRGFASTVAQPAQDSSSRHPVNVRVGRGGSRQRARAARAVWRTKVTSACPHELARSRGASTGCARRYSLRETPGRVGLRNPDCSPPRYHQVPRNVRGDAPPVIPGTMSISPMSRPLAEDYARRDNAIWHKPLSGRLVERRRV